MMKISFTIPTLNRAALLHFTIDHFLPQLKRYANEVELVICNNASDDNTSEVAQVYADKYPNIRFNDFMERADLGGSFRRTAASGLGEYIVLWGDDDIPAPGLVEHLLYLIEENPKVDFFHLNGLAGYEDGEPVKSLYVVNKEYTKPYTIYSHPTEFIKEHFYTATFMTSNMISKKAWNRGLQRDTDSFFGYEFMGTLYLGNGEKPICYSEFPMFIQRKVANRSWFGNWPIYFLLGLPNLSVSLEKEGIYRNGYANWQKTVNKLPIFTYTLMLAATDKKRYRPMCKEFCKYQESAFRKFLVYFIVNCFPGFIYNIIRKTAFKLKQ